MKNKTSTVSTREFEKIYNFLQAANELKFELRYKSNCKSPRKDTSGAHTWRMALLGMLIMDKMPKNFNKLHALKIILAHDLPEAVVGDTPFNKVYDGRVTMKNKTSAERKGMLWLTKKLPKGLSKELHALWEEYEQATTPEAKFAKALDKVEAAFHSLYMGSSTWVNEASYIVHTNKACGLLPQTDELLRFTKAKLKKECKTANIPWRKEYEGFKD